MLQKGIICSIELAIATGGEKMPHFWEFLFAYYAVFSKRRYLILFLIPEDNSRK